MVFKSMSFCTVELVFHVEGLHSALRGVTLWLSRLYEDHMSSMFGKCGTNVI